MSEKIIRVLLVSPLPPPAGGIASWTKMYLQWSKNNSLNVDIVNTSVIGKRAIQINSERSITDEIRRTKVIIKALKNKIAHFNPDIVHINSPCGRFGIIRDYLCALFINKKKTKLVVHYRCNIEDQICENGIRKFFFRRLARKADINLVLNTPSKEFLKRESGKEGILIPNFIDKAYLLDEPKVIKATIKNIVFVGHVQKTKGVLEIIKAASFFPEIKFTLAGPVSNEISSLSLPKNVVMLGTVNQKQVRDLLNESDLFLFPTYTEGFANALLEAMVMGLPIITTAVGANADMIENSGGIIVRKGNYKDIISAIIELEDLEYRKRISSWNINKVKNNYIIDSVMEKLITVYKT